MPIILILAMFGGGIFLLKAREDRKKTQSQAAIDQQAFGGIDPETFGKLPPYQQEQVKRFAAISSIAGATTTTILASGIVGGATAAASGTGAATGLVALAGPVGVAVAAAIIAIGIFRGTAHLVANKWGEQVQVPFGKALSAIADANAEAVRNGSATRYSVQHAKDAINALWAKYKALAEEFAALGKDNRTVITNSYAKIQPTITQLNIDLDANLAAL